MEEFQETIDQLLLIIENLEKTKEEEDIMKEYGRYFDYYIKLLRTLYDEDLFAVKIKKTKQSAMYKEFTLETYNRLIQEMIPMGEEQVKFSRFMEIFDFIIFKVMVSHEGKQVKGCRIENKKFEQTLMLSGKVDISEENKTECEVS